MSPLLLLAFVSTTLVTNGGAAAGSNSSPPNAHTKDVRAVEGSNVTLEFKFDDISPKNDRKRVYLLTPLSSNKNSQVIEETDLRTRAEIGCLDAVSSSKCGEPIQHSDLRANLSGDFDRSADRLERNIFLQIQRHVSQHLSSYSKYAHLYLRNHTALPVNLSLLSDVDQSGRTAHSIIVKEQVNSTLRCRVRGAHPPLERVAWLLSPRNDPGAHAPQAVIPASSSGPLLTDDPNIVDYSATFFFNRTQQFFSIGCGVSNMELGVIIGVPEFFNLTSTSSQLFVHYLNVKFVKQPVGSIIEGQRLLFECQVDIYPESFNWIWSVNGSLQRLPQEERVYNRSTFVIQSPNRTLHGSIVQCAISGITHRASAQSEPLNILFRAESLEFESASAPTGGAGSLSCRAVHSNPAPLLRLYQYIGIDERTREPSGCPNKVGTLVDLSFPIPGRQTPSRWCLLKQSTSTSSLTYRLEHTHASDLGEYLCDAAYESVHNQTRHFEPLRSFALLVPSDRPLRLFAPVNQTLVADVGTSARFLCPVVSVPPARVEWRRKVWDHSGAPSTEVLTSSDELELSSFDPIQWLSLSHGSTATSSTSETLHIDPQLQRHARIHSLLVKTVSEKEFDTEFICIASVEHHEANAYFRLSKPPPYSLKVMILLLIVLGISLFLVFALLFTCIRCCSCSRDGGVKIETRIESRTLNNQNNNQNHSPETIVSSSVGSIQEAFLESNTTLPQDHISPGCFHDEHIFEEFSHSTDISSRSQQINSFCPTTRRVYTLSPLASEARKFFVPSKVANLDLHRSNFSDRGAGGISPSIHSFLSSRASSPRLRQQLLSFPRLRSSFDRHSTTDTIIPILEGPTASSNISFPTLPDAPAPSVDGEIDSYHQQVAAFFQQQSLAHSSSALLQHNNQIRRQEEHESPLILEMRDILSSPEQSPPLELPAGVVPMRGSGSSDSGFDTDVAATRCGGLATATRSGFCSCRYPQYHRILSTTRASISGTPVYACCQMHTHLDGSAHTAQSVVRSISQYVPKTQGTLSPFLPTPTPEPLRVALPEEPAAGPEETAHSEYPKKIPRSLDESCFASLV